MKTQIINWAKERNLINKENAPKQTIKLMEEVGELASSILKDDKEKIIDSIGDCVVVLTILAKQLDLDIDECTKLAYNEIKNRKGVTENGVFMKINNPIDVTKLKVGTKLIAINECEIDIGGKALKVGKEYPINELINDEFCIKSEIFEEHFFNFDTIDEFFKI